LPKKWRKNASGKSAAALRAWQTRAPSIKIKLKESKQKETEKTKWDFFLRFLRFLLFGIRIKTSLFLLLFCIFPVIVIKIRNAYQQVADSRGDGPFISSRRMINGCENQFQTAMSQL
jgi:hypothetical protein